MVMYIELQIYKIVEELFSFIFSLVCNILCDLKQVIGLKFCDEVF